VGKSETVYINSLAEVPGAIQAAVGRMVNEIGEINWSDVLSEQIPALEKMHAGYFAGQRDAGGASWAALSATTVAKKGHGRILDETGALRASLTSSGAGAVRRVSGRELKFGTSVRYATYHQNGFYNVRVNRSVPARPPVGISQEGMIQIATQVADQIVQRL